MLQDRKKRQGEKQKTTMCHGFATKLDVVARPKTRLHIITTWLLYYTLYIPRLG